MTVKEGLKRYWEQTITRWRTLGPWRVGVLFTLTMGEMACLCAASLLVVTMLVMNATDVIVKVMEFESGPDFTATALAFGLVYLFFKGSWFFMSGAYARFLFSTLLEERWLRDLSPAPVAVVADA